MACLLRAVWCVHLLMVVGPLTGGRWGTRYAMVGDGADLMVVRTVIVDEWTRRMDEWAVMPLWFMW